jgi:uncharacterized NAD-dependent epimerase/dehydratase family protein
MPDSMVLCHTAGREAIHGYESFSLPALDEYVDLYENLAAPVHEGAVVAGALNTSDIEDDAEAQAAVDAYAEELGQPATDVVRFDADAVLDSILGAE